MIRFCGNNVDGIIVNSIWMTLKVYHASIVARIDHEKQDPQDHRHI